MSGFRPNRRVTDPGGHEWELYAYKMRVRDRGATFNPGLAPDEPVGVSPATLTFGEAEWSLGVLDALLWGLGLIPRLLVRVLWDIPRAALRVPGSDRWTIEAVNWYPHRTSQTWTTTGEWRDETLAHVADSIQRGVPPRPTNALAGGYSER